MYYNDGLSFFTSFIIGFLGSAHCIGMCGNIFGTISTRILKFKDSTIFFSQLCYNLGRIISYGLIGGFAGFSGFILFDLIGFDFIKYARLTSSLMTLLIGFSIFISFNFVFFFEKIIHLNFNFFNKLLNKILLIKSPYKEFMIGILWGNIPCGFVYSALFLALTSGSIHKSFFLMFFFGLGTVPAMMLTGTLYLKVRNLNKNEGLKRFFGFIVILIGLNMFVNSFFNKTCHLL